MNKWWTREVRLFAVAALLLLLALFVAFNGIEKTYHTTRAFIERAGRQRAIAHTKQHYPSAVVVHAQLVHIGWGEIGEWTIIFEANHTCYHAWYTLDGAMQTEFLTYPQFEGSLCQKKDL